MPNLKLATTGPDPDAARKAANDTWAAAGRDSRGLEGRADSQGIGFLLFPLISSKDQPALRFRV